MRKISVIVLLLAVALLTACSNKPKKIPVYTKANSPIVVSKKQPYFTVKLKSNATTGYAWMFANASQQPMLQVVKHQYQAPNSKLVGAPGFELWTFKVHQQAFNEKQGLYLKMNYQRPWEKRRGGAGATLTFKVNT